MTSSGGGESPEVECCGCAGIQTALSRVTDGGRHCSERLSSCTGRLREAFETTREDRRLGLEEGCCPSAVGRVVDVARPALSGCCRLLGRRLAEAYGSWHPGTARLRESLSFWRAVLAEFVGTFFLVVVGCGSATEQQVYSHEQQLQQDRAVRMALAFGTFNDNNKLYLFTYFI